MQGIFRVFVLVVTVVATVLAPARHRTTSIPATVIHSIDLPAELGVLGTLPALPDNPPSAAKIELGRRLFRDGRLSDDGHVSCATCHIPSRAFADGRRFSLTSHGRPMPRNTPTVLNTAYYRSWNWDGKFTSMRRHAIATMGNPKNMNLESEAVLVARLERAPAYRILFRRAFGGGASLERVGQALEVYQRTLITSGSTFDRYARGDRHALSPAQQRGLMLFTGKANCTECHYGPNFTDDAFHALGMGGDDPGRAKITGLDMDRGTFKTPTLRNVSRTAPYMHDGSLTTLRDVVDFYDAGGGPSEPRTPVLRRLHLSEEEKRDLIAFLESLG
jgi:cytochrome c peroxidase